MKALGILALLFAVPPAGWVLLARQKWSWRAKVPMGLAALGLAVAHLMVVWGMRFQMLGGSTLPSPYFPKRGVYEAIEKRAEVDKVELAKEPPASAPAPVAPVPVPVQVPVTLARGLWPSFLGPNRDGNYTETPIRTEWPATGLPELWRRPVGGGYASMAVAEGLVFTIEQRRDQEAAVAYDFDKGREVWAVTWKANFQESMGGDGPRATPAWHQGRLYVVGAEGEFRCLDAKTGKTLWRKNLLTDNGTAANLMWGFAASPLVLDDKVIVTSAGGPGGKTVVAYDRITGNKVWASLEEKGGYAAPILATFAGEPQIVVVAGDKVLSLAPRDGRLLWSHPWKTEYDVNSVVPTIVGPNRFVVSSGYGHGSALLEVSRTGGEWSVKEVWTSQALKNKFNTQVLLDGVIYGLDEGILTAMDVATGKRLWKGGRYGYGQFLRAGRHLVVLTEDGEVVLVRATPGKHEELAKFKAIDGKTWNVPALAGGRLLVRNTTDMACYRIEP